MANELVTLHSEYATVDVWRDRTGAGERLALRDRRSGRVNWFDALELEALVWTEHSEIEQFLVPERRWGATSDVEVGDDEL